MLVEDDPADEELTARALHKAKIANRIHVARGGAEALDFLHEENHTLRVVSLGLNVPKVGGIEVLRQIWADPQTGMLRLVILSSYTEERDIVSSYCLGANSHIRKPVDFGEFREAVRQFRLYWVLLNELPPAGGGA